MATRGKGEALIRVQTRATRSITKDLSETGERIRRATLDEFRGRLGSEIEKAMIAAAPRGKKPSSVKPGPRLRDTIHVRINPKARGVEANVYAQAIDPRTGYHYTGVTRLGHKKRWIRPLKRRGKGHKVLTFWSPQSGGFISKNQTRGVRPRKDWVLKGFAAADRSAQRAGDRLGRRVITGRRI